jgi:hypothetical protein
VDGVGQGFVVRARVKEVMGLVSSIIAEMRGDGKMLGAHLSRHRGGRRSRGR